MTIKTIYENQGEACIYDDYIDEICIGENGLYYIVKEACIDRAEEDIVLYEDTDKLVEKIKQIMQEIREKESEENK